jgi:hypothetical protein
LEHSFVLYLRMLSRRGWFAGSISLCFAAGVEATLIDVYQAGGFKGTIEAYSGVLSAQENYEYFSHSAHPVEGPNLRYNRGGIFFYDGPEGTTFNAIFNKERQPGDIRTQGMASWNIEVLSPGDPAVLFSDDLRELRETSPDVFKGRWEWRNNTDGGIIAGLEQPFWAMLIDPKEYAGLETLRVFSADGSRINLNLNTGWRGTTIFTLHMPVPDGGSTLAMALGAFGILAAARLRAG